MYNIYMYIHISPETPNFLIYSLTATIYFFQARELQSQQEQLVWKQEVDRKVWHHITFLKSNQGQWWLMIP